MARTAVHRAFVVASRPAGTGRLLDVKRDQPEAEDRLNGAFAIVRGLAKLAKSQAKAA